MGIVVLTAFTMMAFAANSLLCRMALGAELIDPVSFTSIRLVSGALALFPIARAVSEPAGSKRATGSWASGITMFIYAIAFSLAFVSLNTGTGALILFGTVQVTMIGTALRSGETVRPAQWIGSVSAIGGLIYLVLPGLSSPDPTGAALMVVAGIGWGVYSIHGRGARAPIHMTAGNFARAAPFTIVLVILAWPSLHAEPRGIMLALFAGIVTSGLGYIIWYRTLQILTTTEASLVQLVVPALAAFAGVVFLGEHITGRLIVASALILGGVAFAVVKRRPRPRPA